MILRCKPNQLCIITGAKHASGLVNLGKEVRTIRLLEQDERIQLSNGCWHWNLTPYPKWLIECAELISMQGQPSLRTYYGHQGIIADFRLTPIEPDEETVQEAITEEMRIRSETHLKILRQGAVFTRTKNSF